MTIAGQGVSPETLQFPPLKSLSLGVEADDACAARIAECHQRQSLQLVFTSITDDGLKASIMASHPARTVKCKTSDETYRRLVEMLEE